MKRRKKQKESRFKTATGSRPSKPRIIEIGLKDVVTYIKRVEEQVTPLIEAHRLSPADGFFLLAQRVRILITGEPYPSAKSITAIANDIKVIWQAGLYTPAPSFPYSLDTILEDEKKVLATKREYSQLFLPFSSKENDISVGMAEIAAGIVMHPETHLWQIWMIVGAPCIFIGAYHDPDSAQHYLGLVLDAMRKGVTKFEVEQLYEKIQANGEDVPKQIPFDMMRYLMDHLHLYKIRF
ncbi:hypothetical protein KSF_063370 [Reticulibacter mediterranei]|uniref:Uncharacterized protein n=1 Tax=Reticulibacter mediterranei TaxID=2778369 RepID=A0A8J3IQW1_9CHLR|nr:hypothetical protein [Reticulibacter mediterranei]GHO96289.1 hypothetical protein KSF_063370 [Reticulibacter mediterranei]